MSEKSGIKIAGAGPAGLSAAIVLARAGYPVTVFEQHSNVGERFNDDYQGLENWSRDEDVLAEIQRMGIDPSWWRQSFSGGVLYDPTLRPINIDSPRPLFYLVRRGNHHRGSLDLSLRDQALGLGVQFFWKTRADVKDVDIVASGPKGTPVAIARGITFQTDHEPLACAILNDDLAPSGYVYLLIANGQGTLATVLFDQFKDVSICMERSMEAVTNLFGITGFSEAKKWGGYGLFSVPATCEREGVLWVGEAAGFQDLLFGFGIRNALISGALAAKSIIENCSYDALWRARLLPHLKASVVSRALYHGLGDIAKRGFWYLTGKNSRPDRFMHWLYNFSIAHRLLYSFAAVKSATLHFKGYHTDAE